MRNERLFPTHRVICRACPDFINCRRHRHPVIEMQKSSDFTPNHLFFFSSLCLCFGCPSFFILRSIQFYTQNSGFDGECIIFWNIILLSSSIPAHSHIVRSVSDIFRPGKSMYVVTMYSVFQNFGVQGWSHAFYSNISPQHVAWSCLMMMRRLQQQQQCILLRKETCWKRENRKKGRKEGRSALSRKSGNWGRGAKFVLRSRLLEVEHAFVVHFYCTQQNIVYFACVWSIFLCVVCDGTYLCGSAVSNQKQLVCVYIYM